MKFLALSALLLAASASAKAPKHHELDESYDFATYVKDFSKNYNPEEYARREALFQANLKDIMQHNQLLGRTYHKGVNHFTDFAEEEGHFGYAKGATSSWANVRTLTHDELPFEVEPASALPASVDWREKGVVTAVKDQGGCGSCWAFAASAVLESHIAIETGTLFNLAPQEFVSCMPNPEKCGGTGGCAGATVDLAFDYAMKNGGIVQEYQMGYTSYYGEDGDCTIHPDENFLKSADGPDPDGITGGVANIEDYVKLPTNDYLALLNAVAKTGPVAVSVAASPWKSYESGIFQGSFDDDSLDVNHAVTLVGYGTDEKTGMDYWLVRNSWKPTWAEAGYIRLLRVDPDELNDPNDICGTDSKPQDGTACEGQTANITVCGTSAIHFDNVIPVGGHLLV
jgi:cathepsin L